MRDDLPFTTKGVATGLAALMTAKASARKAMKVRLCILGRFVLGWLLLCALQLGSPGGTGALEDGACVSLWN